MVEIKKTEIKKNLWLVGSIDNQLKYFDITLKTEFGTTYNSYVLKTSQGVILFETTKEIFADEYIKAVDELVGLENVKYLVMNHTEPDHSGTVSKLLQKSKKIQIVGTLSAINFIKEITNLEFESIAVKDGEILSVGDRTLQFYVLPYLHWPDTMFTFIKEDKCLVTCDSFGSHYACDEMFVTKISNHDSYIKAAKYYHDNILKPYAHPYMENGLNVAKSISPDCILTGHGPILDDGGKEMFELYDKWLSSNKSNEKCVVMAYVSSYGYTKTIAEYLKKGMEKSGKIKVKMFDMLNSTKEEVLDSMNDCVGIALGTPTILSTAVPMIYELTAYMNPVLHSKIKATAFGSYGWSSEAVPNLIDRFRQLKMTVLDSGFRVRFKPNDADLQAAEKFGEDFVKTLAL